MKIFEFAKMFPDEESCRRKFREIREKEGVICPKCGCTHHYWKSYRGEFQCAKCGHRQSLRASSYCYCQFENANSSLVSWHKAGISTRIPKRILLQIQQTLFWREFI